MSGLAVRYHRDGRPVESSLLWSMLGAIPYRALDGMWVHHWDRLALGYAKLTITPEEVDEIQPLVSARTGCAVIADVRLDNRRHLQQHLDVPEGLSDAELILRAYEHWGPDCATQLLGDFAFVVWDPRHQHLVCARDSSGQRSLYYRLDSTTFAAASEIHQIFQDDTVPIEPNDDHILFSLLPDNVFRNEKQYSSTYYRDVYAVPAGHVLIVDPENHRLWRYWELVPQDEIRYRHDHEYAEHFRDLLFTVVEDRLRSLYPIGALLSGGLDSGSVVCTAQELLQRRGVDSSRMVAFSSVFDGLDCDERAYIESIRSKYDLDVRYIPATSLNNRLQLVPQRFQASPNMSLNDDRNTLLGTAQASGARVLLTGDVADSCVQGTWLVFDSLLRQRRLRDLRNHASSYRQALDVSPRMVALHTLAPLLPLPLQRQLMIISTKRWLARNEGLLLPDWMPESLRASLEQRTAEVVLDTERSRRFANQTRHAESRLLDPPEVAGHPAPWSLQAWRPFADRRLHEFLLAIPPEQKFNVAADSGGPYARSKWILRRAMEGILPDMIRLRTDKTQFSQAHANSIDANWPIYEAAFHPSGKSEIAERGYVMADTFWERLLEARTALTGADSVYVTRMVGLETWLRTFELPRSQLTAIPLAIYQAAPVADTRAIDSLAESGATTRSHLARGGHEHPTVDRARYGDAG